MDISYEMKAILDILAADVGAEPQAFLRSGVTVVEYQPRDGRRDFPLRPELRGLGVITLGAGAVVSCHASRLEWARAHLAIRTRDELFSAPLIGLMQQAVQPDGLYMAGPDLKFVCPRGRVQKGRQPPGVQFRLLAGDEIQELYTNRHFPHALRYSRRNARPDVLAVVARCYGHTAGVAGASADNDRLWQVGVDVAPDFRGKGIGRSLVAQLTEAIWQAGRIPYYSTWISNIASQRLATRVGYRLAWTELYTRRA